ncbi:MAG: hypothetical protein IKB32_00845 [Clostridia bacterium]|nr:hypothetical protein [Clostridia bacterium]
MGISYSFIDNSIYGPDDINDITKSLTGAGIAPFISKDSYNVSDLNEMTSALVGSGVQLGGCLCSIENAGTADMIATVAQGIVFFESGVRLTVDENGYVLPITPNTAGHIYAHYSPSLQKADIIFGMELPADGESVPLAEVLADGRLLDKRIFAQSKVATFGKNISLSVPFVSIDPVLIRTVGDGKYYKVASVQGVDLSKFNYAVVTVDAEPTPESLRITTFYDIVRNQGIFSIIDNDSAFAGGSLGTVVNYSMTRLVEVCDNELCIVARCSTTNNGEKYLSMFKNHAYFAMLM